MGRLHIFWMGGEALMGVYIPLMGYGPHEVDVLHEGDVPSTVQVLPSEVESIFCDYYFSDASP